MGKEAQLTQLSREDRELRCNVCCLSPVLVPPGHSQFSAFQSDIIFQDLEKLKSHPAYLVVFLRYIFSQADPGPLVSQKFSVFESHLYSTEDL